MNIQLTLDWKSFAIIGAALIGHALVKRVPTEQTTNVLNHLFDTIVEAIGDKCTD